MLSTRVPPLEDDFPFDIVSRLVPVTPFREYPRAIIDERKGVRVALKQYIPRHQPQATTECPDPITIIAAGGLGFVKELYEPLFVEILLRARDSGVIIKSIWMADMFNVGESAIANQDNLGCDPAWTDHSRDLWSIIHQFSAEMPRPIFGLGHSFGCNQLICLATWHPSLFHSLAFVEPGIDPKYGRGLTVPWSLSTLKHPDSWKTKEEADAGLVKSQRAQHWDARVLARLKHYSVYNRETSDGRDWAMTTPKDQVVALISRFNPDRVGLGPGGIDSVTLAQRESIPDGDPDGFNFGPFYRRELQLAWDMLPNLRPWALLVNGGKSPFFGYPQTRDERARITGTGIGGNGGVRLGAVRQVVIEDGEHAMVFDRNVTTVADHVAGWLSAECRRWTGGPRKRQAEWQMESLEKKQTLGTEYFTALSTELASMKRAGKL